MKKPKQVNGPFKGPLTACFTSGNWHVSGSLATIRFWHDVYLIVLMIHAKNDMTCKFRNWPAALESYKTDIFKQVVLLFITH